MSYGFKSNGARMPVHRVEKVKPSAAIAPPKPGMAGGGSSRINPPAPRAPVTLAEIPSLSREIALTLEDGLFMHAVRMAAEAMIEGALPDVQPFTLEEEGALVRAFSSKVRRHEA